MINIQKVDKIINEARKKNKTFEEIRNDIITKLSKFSKVVTDKNQKNLVMLSNSDMKFGTMIVDIYTGKLICGDLPAVNEVETITEEVEATTLLNGITLKLYYYCGKWRLATTKYIDAYNTKYKNIPIANTFFNFIKNNNCFVELNKIGDRTPVKVDINKLDTRMTYIYSYYDPALSNVVDHGSDKLCRYIGCYDVIKKIFTQQNTKFKFDKNAVDSMEVGIISDKYIVYSDNYKKRQAILSNIQNETFCILKNINNRDEFIKILGKSYEDKFDSLLNFLEDKFKNILLNYENVYKLKVEDVFVRFEIICTKLHMCYLQKAEIDLALVKKIFYSYPTEVQAFIVNIKI